MTIHGNSFTRSRIPHDISAIRGVYHRKIGSLIKRIKNGRSMRSLAAKIGISHTTLQNIVKHPDHDVSRKVMLKIIRKTSRPGRRKKLAAPMISKWMSDAK